MLIPQPREKYHAWALINVQAHENCRNTSWILRHAVPQNDILTFGKLRASYGTVGIEPGLYLSTTDYISGGAASGWGAVIDAALYG